MIVRMTFERGRKEEKSLTNKQGKKMDWAFFSKWTGLKFLWNF